jgi:hypothetical protein
MTQPTTPIDPSASSVPIRPDRPPIVPLVQPARVRVEPRLARPRRRLVIAAGGLAFAIGRVTALTAESATGPFAGTGVGGAGGNGFGPGASGFVPGAGGAGPGAIGGILGGDGAITLRGTVAEVSADKLSLTLADGTTVSVPLDASTTYHQQAGASTSDVTVGRTVLVQLSGFGRGVRGSVDPAATPNPDQAPSVGPATDVTVTPE